MIGIGAAIGLPAALWLTRLVQSFLYGLTPQDPASIALATTALAVITGLSGYIPARRATRVDPMIAFAVRLKAASRRLDGRPERGH
jgi:putative ABC transport system permease protein